MEKIREIDKLLEAYYNGTTTAEDEVRLYILLMGQSHNSPYYADRKLLEAGFAQWQTAEAQPESTAVRPQETDEHSQGTLQKIWSVVYPLRYAVAAVFVGVVALVALQIQAPKHQIDASTTAQWESHYEYSFVNGTPMGQEQAERYALEAIQALSTCYQAQRNSQETLQETLDEVQTLLDRNLFQHVSGQ